MSSNLWEPAVPCHEPNANTAGAKSGKGAVQGAVHGAVQSAVQGCPDCGGEV